MSTLSDLIGQHAHITAVDVDWLHLLVSDWQVLSDLSFADLVLWFPTEDGDFIAVAQCRPSTGATLYDDDIVGQRAPESQRSQLSAALLDGQIQRAREPHWHDEIAVRDEAVPVVRTSDPIAVIARQTSFAPERTPSRLEFNYLAAADEIFRMISTGEFPSPGAPTGPRRGAPRVGDGLVRLDADGQILYASPNAMSCFHRLGMVGDLTGRSLAELTTEVVEEYTPVDESLPLVVMGRAPWRTEVESHSVVLSLRAVPLTEEHQRIGAVLLCRDVSELRRQERELMTKEATIREIHHRVKNNLQTVAALLRLQARRTPNDEARSALQEAMRRVATIALVHETLSQTFEETVSFDDVADRSLRLAADVASAGLSVKTVRDGRFGVVRAEDATALALVLTELVTNAVEHGLAPAGGGTVTITTEREEQHLRVVVADDGVGLPSEGSTSLVGLGSQIVSTLVTGELHGIIDWRSREGGGTEVILEMSLRDCSRLSY